MKLVSPAQLASALGVSERRAQVIFKQGHYKNHTFSVTAITGEKARGGVRIYALFESLPVHIQEAISTSQDPFEEPSKPILTDGVAKKTRWFVEVFADVLAAPKGSLNRGALMQGLIGSTVIDWNGEPRKISKKMAYTWVQKYERDGMAGLARKQNSSIGKKRVHFSKKFDDFMRKHGVGEQQIQLIAESAHEYIAGLTLEGKKPKVMRVLGCEKLMKLARLAGVTKPTDLALKAACAVSRNYFGRLNYRTNKKVYTHLHNRKASYDKQPRIFRVNPDRPAEIYVLDVHHVNVYVKRPDGSLATPKCLAIMDLATQRVWCDLVLPEKGGGIRQEHIAYGLAGCMSDEYWGVPEAIYIDNGSEYKFMEVLEDALQLNNRALLGNRRNLVINALPRNAAAKAVEGHFARFSQQFLRGCKGYVGDDRMNAELPDMGKPIAPFGTFEQFQTFFYAQLEAYELMPQDGQLNGVSPRERLQISFDNGWSATIVDQLELLSIITKPVERVVRQGVVYYGNEPYGAPEIRHVQWQAEKVLLHVPRAHDFDALRITDLNGNDICVAYRMPKFGVLDGQGAIESARQKKEYNASFSQIRRSVPKTDGNKDIAAFVENEKLRNPLRPNAAAGRLSVNPMARVAGEALIHSKEPVDFEAERRKKEKIKAEQEKIWLQLEENWKASDV